MSDEDEEEDVAPAFSDDRKRFQKWKILMLVFAGIGSFLGYEGSIAGAIGFAIGSMAGYGAVIFVGTVIYRNFISYELGKITRWGYATTCVLASVFGGFGNIIGQGESFFLGVYLFTALPILIIGTVIGYTNKDEMKRKREEYTPNTE